MMGTWYFPGPDGRFHPQDERTMDPRMRAYLEALSSRMNNFNIRDQNNGSSYGGATYANAAYGGGGGSHHHDNYFKEFRRVLNDSDTSNASYCGSATDTDSEADFGDDSEDEKEADTGISDENLSEQSSQN